MQGIEGAAESLEQLWISYNQIDRMKPIRALQRLKILYMSHNYVREWREFDHMAELPALEDLVFIGNPLEEETSNSGKYTDEVIKRLLYLKKLDGYPVIRERDNEDDEDVKSTLDAEEIENMARYFQTFSVLSALPKNIFLKTFREYADEEDEEDQIEEEEEEEGEEGEDGEEEDGFFEEEEDAFIEDD